MTQNQHDGFDPADPIGLWRTLRDTNLEAWSRGMASFVNTEAFAQALGLQLDAYLSTSVPFQRAFERYMEAYLAHMNMPSRPEVISLAQRMTNVEMRLDDIDARTEEILQTLRAQAPVIVEMLEERYNTPHGEPEPPAQAKDITVQLQSLEDRTAQLLELVRQLHQPAPPEPPPAKPRSRRGARTVIIDDTIETKHDRSSDRAIEGFGE